MPATKKTYHPNKEVTHSRPSVIGVGLLAAPVAWGALIAIGMLVS